MANTVRELIAELQKLDQDAPLRSHVRWAVDSAYSDEGGEIGVTLDEGSVVLSGWMSDCSTELQFERDEDESGS
jgi:hypothetical protein